LHHFDKDKKDVVKPEIVFQDERKMSFPSYFPKHPMNMQKSTLRRYVLLFHIREKGPRGVK